LNEAGGDAGFTAKVLGNIARARGVTAVFDGTQGDAGNEL
jgi:DNA-binding phage protein